MARDDESTTWEDRVERRMVCPQCRTANRRGAIVVRLNRTLTPKVGTAWCSQCGYEEEGRFFLPKNTDER